MGMPLRAGLGAAPGAPCSGCGVPAQSAAQDLGLIRVGWQGAEGKGLSQGWALGLCCISESSLLWKMNCCALPSPTHLPCLKLQSFGKQDISLWDCTGVLWKKKKNQECFSVWQKVYIVLTHSVVFSYSSGCAYNNSCSII